MGIFKPTKYYKNIYSINYKLLKEEGIKCLVFDLDNTLGPINDKNCPEETKKLFKKLKKDFIIVVCSNNTNKRLASYLEQLEVEGIGWSFKPTTRALKKIKNKYNLKKKEMVMIGDQILTDVLAGKRYKIKTILVDQYTEQDLKITGLNRKIENFIVKKYEKRKVFERGKYYE